MNTIERSLVNGEASEPLGLPLAGVRILDLTRALAGPFCTALLGDLGADVIKVESLDGEVCRKWGPFHGAESVYFLAVNRNKRSLAMDIWSDAGREALRAMAGQFDVIVENFRPGVLGELGLSDEWMQSEHPDVILTHISGFGHVGPRSGEACFDQIAQGMGGLMSVTGTEESGPMRHGTPLADILTGIFAALGVCASLAGKRSGQMVHTSLLESALAVLTFHGQRYLSLGEVSGQAGNDHPLVSPYGVFRTADQPINVAAGTRGQWQALCDVIGAVQLVDDPRFVTPTDRQRNREQLRKEIESRLVREGSAEWLVKFKAAAIPAGPINDIGQAFEEPQVDALGMVQTAIHADLGPIPNARGPLWIGGESVAVRQAAPALGQHTLDVLHDCGFTESQIELLQSNGIVHAQAPSAQKT